MSRPCQLSTFIVAFVWEGFWPVALAFLSPLQPERRAIPRTLLNRLPQTFAFAASCGCRPDESTCFFATVRLRRRLDRSVLVAVTIAPIARGISILLISICSIVARICVRISTRVSLGISRLRILGSISAFCIWKENHGGLGHGAIAVQDPDGVRRGVTVPAHNEDVGSVVQRPTLCLKLLIDHHMPSCREVDSSQTDRRLHRGM